MITELRKFVAPEFIFGAGARTLAGQYAANFGARRVLLVTDPGVIKAGWIDPLLEDLHQHDLDTIVFEHVHSNPRDHEVMEGAELYQRSNCNAIVVMGGGSPMDCAKGIGIVSSNHKNVLEFEGVDEVAVPGPPLICIPTTAGSSADVSQFAIINDEARRVKIAIISKTVVPDLALIDPEPTTTMDPYLTACTGLDALTHAFEAYVSNAQSSVTDLHALEAVRLIHINLINAIREPAKIEWRDGMMLGSLHAGLAFSNASLGAVHAMAHSLGGYLDLPHGECNALLLEHVVKYNFEAVPQRYVRLGQAMGLDLSTQQPDTQRSGLIEGLRWLRREAGIERSIGKIGVKPADLAMLAEKAAQDPCLVTNPRDAEARDLEIIYANAL